MNRLVNTLLAGAALFAAAVPTLGQDNQADPNKTFDIKAKFTVGDVLKYTMKMDMDMAMTVPNGQSPFPGGKMEMSSDLKYKTVGAKPDGTAVVVVQTENQKTTMGGNPFPAPSTPPITLEIDARGVGKVRGLENAPGGPALSQFMNMNRMPTLGIVLPDHPVKIGETWGLETPSPIGKIKIDCTLLGVESVGGADTLKIKMVTNMPMNMMMGQGGIVTDPAKAMVVMSGSATSNSIVNILADSARIVKMAGDMNSAIKMEMKGEAASQSPFGSEMNMKMDGKINMDLVSVGKAPVEPAPKPTAKPAASTSKTPATAVKKKK